VQYAEEDSIFEILLHADVSLQGKQHKSLRTSEHSDVANVVRGQQLQDRIALHVLV
jgi:hypothetical protein